MSERTRQWLLDADPAIRWQVMRDLTDAPAQEIAAERAKVATAGWGAQLLALQGDDGQWGGAAPAVRFGPIIGPSRRHAC